MKEYLVEQNNNAKNLCDGCVGVEPGVHFGFSTVIYNRMLTQVEIDHFSLEPIGWRLPCA